MGRNYATVTLCRNVVTRFAELKLRQDNRQLAPVTSEPEFRISANCFQKRCLEVEFYRALCSSWTYIKFVWG